MRIRSVIGRFLEHSRIFYFAAGQHEPSQGGFFIGSADWMFRNLWSRVEVVAPVMAKPAREKLWEILNILLRDERQAWLMASDGQYSQLQPRSSGNGPEHMGAHATLIELARQRHAAG